MDESIDEKLAESTEERRVSWSHGELAVTSLAAMLTELVFHLEHGDFRPLARAPWLDDAVPASRDRPAPATHLDVLAGEFACVPFGTDHGYGANSRWDVAVDGGGVRAAIDYPRGSPISRLERRITPCAGEARVVFDLVIHAREKVRLPIGVHPILRLPSRPRALSIQASFDSGHTHPSAGERRHVTSHGARFTELSRVPAGTGTVDLSRLPLASETDPAMARGGVDDGGMLCGARSPLSVLYLDEDAELVMEWDDTTLPSINYWYSDRGVTGAPWDGRYRGLGIEPVCAYFDCGAALSAAPNAISDDGVSTTLTLTPDEPITIAYSLAARSHATDREGTAHAH